MKLRTLALLLGASVLCHRAAAQSYAINWYKIAGGGGASANGQFTLRGAIGQPDAGVSMSGGAYALTGGFWSIHAVQQPGVPELLISRSGANTVTVLWPDANTNSYTLQQTSNLNGGAWTTSVYPITHTNGTNGITIASPSGNLFFRLKQ